MSPASGRWCGTSQVKSPTAQRFTTAFTKKYGKPPENQAWGDYLSTKHLAQAMNDIKTTDSTKVAEHMEKGARFDVLKTREGYYRAWDHQLMQQMYTVTFKPEAQVKDKWELFNLSAPVPADKPEPRNHRADARGKPLHDAGLIAR